MKNLNVSALFYKKLKLDSLLLSSNDVDDIIGISFKYVLGLTSFPCVRKEMAKYKLQSTFPKVLKTLDSSISSYLMAEFRRIILKKVKSRDEFWIKKYRLFHEPIQIRTYPSETKIIQIMHPYLKKYASKLDNTTSIHFDDAYSELSIKLLVTYRTYIYGYKTVLGKKAFLYLLHKCLASGSLDLIRSTKTGNLIPLTNYYQIDSFESNSKYPRNLILFDDPESCLIASQSFSHAFNSIAYMRDLSKFLS